MKKYKGYYIDGVVFKSKKDIDEFYKNNIISKIKVFHSLLFEMPEGHYSDKEKLMISDEITIREKRLHDEYNMSWEEIEMIPF